MIGRLKRWAKKKYAERYGERPRCACGNVAMFVLCPSGVPICGICGRGAGGPNYARDLRLDDWLTDDYGCER